MFKILTLSFLLIATYTHTIFADKPEITTEERAKIESVIYDYLLTNPEIIELAFRELQLRRIDTQRVQMLKVVENYREYLETGSNAGVLGNPDGDVTIVEFFDYRCGYCRRHFADVLRLVKEDGNIRWVARHFPILDRPGEAPLSKIAARAAIAAQRQGKFEAFHLAMMAGTESVTLERINAIAREVDLDMAQMKKDMKDVLTDKQITNTLAIGTDVGFTGTPGYVIGNTVLLGAEGYDAVRRAVVLARKDNTKE